jgi:hypothetical protein
MAQSDLRRVERFREALEDARAGLFVAILQARESGETLRDIAKAAGLSHQRVHQIIQQSGGLKEE